MWCFFIIFADILVDNKLFLALVIDMNRPLILISNDDGYGVKGIECLTEIARQYGDVVVIAPDGPRSGASLSVTFHVPVSVRLISEEPGLKVYACSGTPGDCLKMGVARLCDREPSLVLAGINHGDNAGINMHYSGTMGVVIEGCLRGIPSIGFSHLSHSWETDFTPMVPFIHKIIAYVLENGLPKGVCLNVNAPDIAEYKGLKVCSMGMGQWNEEWDERTNPRGLKYYWLVGHFDSADRPEDNTDRNWLAKGYVTVVPTKIDVSDYESIKTLRVLSE